MGAAPGVFSGARSSRLTLAPRVVHPAAAGVLTEFRADGPPGKWLLCAPLTPRREGHSIMTNQPASPGILLRVELVRSRMHSWGLTPSDPGYIDPADPANLDPADRRSIRADHPALPAYYDRIRAEGQAPIGEPDDVDELRRRAGM